jgi:hypothetical protein
MRKWMITISLIGILSCLPIFAQGTYLGPNVGIFKSNDSDNANVLYGVNLRIKSSPIFGIEGAISYRQEKYSNESVTVKTWPITVTALLYPLPIAYGAMGAGWYNTTIEYDPVFFNLEDNSRTTREFGWHFGGGVELPAGKATKVFGDIRYTFLDYNFEALPTSDDIDSNFYVITIGFLWEL